MSVITYTLAANQTREKYDVVFEDVYYEMLENIRLGAVIRDEKLSQLEAGGDFIIDLRENGNPLYFNDFVDAEERAAALSAAHDKADAMGVSEVSISAILGDYPSAEFELKTDEGQEYRARAMVIRTSDDSLARLTVIMSLSNLSAELSVLSSQFLIVGGAAVLLMAAISFFLSTQAVKPVKKSIEDQNEFIACASHELRSPLAVIRAALSVYAENKNADRLSSVVDGESERMARLTDDLLCLASSDADRWRLQSESVGLDVFLLETVEAMAPVAARKKHPFKTDVPDSLLPSVTTDKARLRQIVEILINNALEHTDEGTAVTLGARNGRNAVIIFVADNGNGISDKDKKRVFERFFRADASRTDKAHFGLGLSVAKELSLLLGGALSVRDTEGGGATFVLSLPKK